MSRAIKIRRPGLGKGFTRKVPFREWLNEQPRSALTYRKDIPRKDEKVWTTEDFVMEGMHRGVDVRMMTAYRWCSGTQPRWMAFQPLQRVFKTIRFK